MDEWTFLFDLDGTLATTDPLQVEAYKQAFGFQGLVIRAEDFLRHKGGKDILERICSQYNFELEVPRFLIEKNLIYHRLVDEKLEPIPGAASFVKQVKEMGYNTAVVSSSSRPNIRKLLQVLRLETEIDFFLGAEDTQFGKPDPAIYLLAAERHKTVPEKCIVFEDSEKGLMAASRAGMMSVAITVNSDHRDDLSSAAHQFSTFNDIDISVLLEHFRA